MAQPIRNSGCRPFTSRSNARGTSGTRPGNRWAISAGGVPIVSDARQTTTPPVSLKPRNSATACAPAPRRERWDARRPMRSVASAHRQPPPAAGGGPPLKTVAKNSRSQSRAATSPPRRWRSTAEKRGRSRERGAMPPTPNAAFADAAAEPDRRPRRSWPVLTSTARYRRCPRHDRDRTGRRSGFHQRRGWRKINEIARQRVNRRPIDDRRLFRPPPTGRN